MTTDIQTQEIWKDVVGYENLYQVSNLGRVKSLARKTNNQFCRKDIILAVADDTYGYDQVLLCRRVNGLRVKNTIKVHRLVATAFIVNVHNKPLINHKDWNRKNNHVSNLEWCTSKENLNHRNPNKTVKLKWKKLRESNPAAS